MKVVYEPIVPVIAETIVKAPRKILHIELTREEATALHAELYKSERVTLPWVEFIKIGASDYNGVKIVWPT